MQMPTNARRFKSATDCTWWNRFLKSWATLHICQVLLKANSSYFNLMLLSFIFETGKLVLSHYVLSDMSVILTLLFTKNQLHSNRKDNQLCFHILVTLYLLFTKHSF